MVAKAVSVKYTTAVSLLLLGLWGCSSAPTTPDGAPIPAFSPDAPVTLPDPQLGKSEAVAGLLVTSERHVAAGDWSRAIATLERAVRIHPRAPELWQRLAQAHLGQRSWRRAEFFALRSNSMTLNQPALQAENWRIVATARAEQGDEVGAQAAESRRMQLIDEHPGLLQQ